MKPLPDKWVALLPADRARYQEQLEGYRERGLSDEHPLPARLIRRIAVIDRLLAAMQQRDAK